MHDRHIRGFSLVELLVVIGIIAVLLSILMPVLGRAREAARRAQCMSNLRQLVLATHTYSVDYKRYPSLGDYPLGASGTSWSVHAKLLPYLGQKSIADRISLSAPFGTYPDVTRQRIAVLICPSERNDRESVEGPLTHYPTTYGASAGTWLVHDPTGAARGDGAFVPNLPLTPSSFTDPTSQTIAFAEVKAFTSYLRDGGTPSGPGAPPPTGAAAISGFGGSLRVESGHTQWVDGNVHQTGVTMTLPPNTEVSYTSGGRAHDVDFTSSREGRTVGARTYAAVTSRSYHPGLVNVAMMDGSVQSIADGIDVREWRAMGTRAGND